MTIHSCFLINCKRIQGTAEEYLPRGESNCQLKNVNPAKTISLEQSKTEIFQGSATLFHPQIFGKEYTSKKKKKRIYFKEDFPGGPVVKNLPASAWDTGLIPDPWRFHMLQGN